MNPEEDGEQEAPPPPVVPPQVNEDNSNSSSLDFETAFGPLAHHMFPDGCPFVDDDNDNNDDDSNASSLSSVWPRRCDRTAVSAKEARASISQLSQVAKCSGLTPLQLSCVTLVACETLPKRGVGVGAGSSLVDGTCKVFQDLVKCLLPKRNHHDSNGTSSAVPPLVILKLLSAIQCRRRDNSATTTATVVLRFLTLAVRNGCIVGCARQTLSSLYGVIFCTVPYPDSCGDAVRLLHAMTRRRHVRVDRAKRLRQWYNQSIQQQQENNNNPNRLASIWLLLQLYARYDPSGCGAFFPSYRRRMGSSAWSRCFQIPDAAWEEAFAGKGRIVVSTETSSRSPDETTESRPNKRQRRTDTTLSSTLEWLEDAFDGVHSFSGGLGNHHERRTLRASDLLMDESLQHLILLAAKDDPTKDSDSGVSQTEVIRLQACLPYMLHEEWYHRDDRSHNDDNGDDDDDDSTTENDSIANSEQKEDDESSTDNESNVQKKTQDMPSSSTTLENSRIRLLKALASMALHSDSLFPEAESFLLEEILPHWDGSDHMGLLVCHDLLSMISPMTFGDLHSSVLRYLSLLFTYGSPRIQYAIVSGALSSLLRRWGRLDWSNCGILSSSKQQKRKGRNLISADQNDPNGIKSRTLRDLIQWTDSLLLKGFLVDDGHELLRQASLDFFDAVADLSSKGPFLGAPSPALAYRWLLSRSVLSIDRVCQLLVKYKGVFHRLKSEGEAARESDTAVDGLDRIAIFNCFLWDFCSVLWRCSPLPALDDPDNLARSKSILFTDLSPNMWEKLHADVDATVVALSITHGAVFAGYVSDFLERHQLSSPTMLLRGKIKVRYLDYLKERGLEGVYSFLTTFVGSLADREARKQARRGK